MKQRSEYLDLRRKFEPASATLVIVAESPPVSGLYFYKPDGKVTEPLFSALMKHLGVRPGTKLEGLVEFQKRGWALVDATYEPVNGLTGRGRDLVIERDYLELRDDLRQLMADRWSVTPLVLLKANVCRLLEPKLRSDGFNVLNNGRVVYFPSHGRQGDFDRQFAKLRRHSRSKGQTDTLIVAEGWSVSEGSSQSEPDPRLSGRSGYSATAWRTAQIGLEAVIVR